MSEQQQQAEPKRVAGENNDSFELFEFSKESKNAGFKYWFRSFNCDTDEQAEASLETIVEQYGSTRVVQIINSSLKAATSRKCVSLIPESDAAKDEALQATGGVLVSKDDAEKFVPGEREASIQKLGRELQKAMVEGRLADAQKIMAELNERVNAAEERLDSAEDDGHEGEGL